MSDAAGLGVVAVSVVLHDKLRARRNTRMLAHMTDGHVAFRTVRGRRAARGFTDIACRFVRGHRHLIVARSFYRFADPTRDTRP